MLDKMEQKIANRRSKWLTMKRLPAHGPEAIGVLELCGLDLHSSPSFSNVPPSLLPYCPRGTW